MIAIPVSQFSSNTCGNIFASYPTIVAKGNQGFEEEIEVNLPILIWFVSSWDLTDLDVSCGWGRKEPDSRRSSLQTIYY